MALPWLCPCWCCYSDPEVSDCHCSGEEGKRRSCLPPQPRGGSILLLPGSPNLKWKGHKHLPAPWGTESYFQKEMTGPAACSPPGVSVGGRWEELGGTRRNRSASETGPVSGRVAWSSGSLSLSLLIFKMGLTSHLPGHCEDYNQHTVAQGRSQDVPKVTVDRKERSRKGQR